MKPQHQTLLSWLVLPAALATAYAGFLYRGEAPKSGSHRLLHLVLKPGDLEELGCADTSYGGASCAWRETGEAREVKQRLIPVQTTRREVLLLSGLQEDPTVRDYLAEGHPLTTRCEVQMQVRLAQAKVRYKRDTAFGTARGVWVGHLLSCDHYRPQ